MNHDPRKMKDLDLIMLQFIQLLSIIIILLLYHVIRLKDIWQRQPQRGQLPSHDGGCLGKSRSRFFQCQRGEDRYWATDSWAMKVDDDSV